jgi:mannonate dehydratase
VQLTFRWFGPGDPVTLEEIRQIPGVSGIVTALHDVPPGDVWPLSSLESVAETIDKCGLSFSVVESIPVHEDIKLGSGTRDALIENYGRSIENVARAGVRVVCYNFMPVFDWMRTDLARELPDGSTALAFDERALAAIDLSQGTGDLPGWSAAYDGAALDALRRAYRDVPAERLWENLAYFLERIIPVAERAGVRMAIHPDDPPWPIFGLPRIISDIDALQRVVSLVPRPANGVTFCTGSLAANTAANLVEGARALAGAGKVHFVHARNIKVIGAHSFEETAHPSEYGDVNMRGVITALRSSGFHGPVRSDHGRMIWGETGRPGYGLYDRALGAAYLNGLWEGIAGEKSE